MNYVVGFQLKGMLAATQQVQMFTKALQAMKAANMGFGPVGGMGGGGPRMYRPPAAPDPQIAAMKQMAQQMSAQAQAVKAQMGFYPKGSPQSAQIYASAAQISAQAAHIQLQAAKLQGGNTNTGAAAWKAQAAATKAQVAQHQSAQATAAAMIQHVSSGANGGMSANAVIPVIEDVFKLIGALGPEAELAAVGIGALIAAMTAAAMAATQYGVNSAQVQMSTGGTDKEAAQLIAAGAIAGIGANQMASMANGYNESLKNNPYANARAQANGYGPNYAGPFGDMDNSKRFLKGLNDMLHAKTDSEAMRMAKGTPLESLEWMRKASPGAVEAAMASATMASSPQAQRDAVDTQLMMNAAMAQTNLLLAQLGEVMLPAIVSELTLLNLAFMQARLAVTELEFGFFLLEKWLHDHLHLPGDEPVWGGSPTDQKNKASADAQAKHTDALNRNTDSNNANTRALNGSNQIFGGGENARKALPAKWIGPNSTQSQINWGQIPN